MHARQVFIVTYVRFRRLIWGLASPRRLEIQEYTKTRKSNTKKIQMQPTVAEKNEDADHRDVELADSVASLRQHHQAAYEELCVYLKL